MDAIDRAFAHLAGRESFEKPAFRVLAARMLQTLEELGGTDHPAYSECAAPVVRQDSELTSVLLLLLLSKYVTNINIHYSIYSFLA